MTRMARALHFRIRFHFITEAVSSLVDRNSDLSAGVTGFEIFVGGGGFSKRIGFRESGHDLSAFYQIAQNAEVFFVNIDAKADKLLVRKFRTKGGGEHASHSGQGLVMHS